MARDASPNEPMPAGLQAQIVLAAITAVGPIRYPDTAGPQPDGAASSNGTDHHQTTNPAELRNKTLEAWRRELGDRAAEIAAMVNPASTISQRIESVYRAEKVIIGTVLSIAKDPRNQRARAVIFTDTKQEYTDPDLPAGTEPITTEPHWNEAGRALANKIHSLIGHRIRAWIELQEAGGPNRKMRVVHHVEDLGIDTREELAELLPTRNGHQQTEAR